MTRISAGDNIVIEMASDRWRLLVNTDFVENVNGSGVLMEAMPDQPLRYTSPFARTRRFPKGGSLSTKYIERVLLGWNEKDEAYHLGLVVGPKLAEARGSRWCELARWPDPEREVFRQEAQQAGQALADVLGCPFRVAPEPKRKAPPPEQIVPLPSLPLAMQEWEMSREPNGWLVFVRQGQWARERVRRVAWYGFWTVIYILLALATLRSDIALPRPAFLPYLGLATAAMLVVLVAYSVYELRNKARRIVIDPATRQVWGTVKDLNGKPVWRMGREHVDSVYVSQVVKLATETKLEHAEINLRLTSGGYRHLIRQEDEETLSNSPSFESTTDIFPLDRTAIQTEMQAAGAYIADALGVPVWYDHRVK